MEDGRFGIIPGDDKEFIPLPEDRMMMKRDSHNLGRASCSCSGYSVRAARRRHRALAAGEHHAGARGDMDRNAADRAWPLIWAAVLIAQRVRK